MRDSIDFGFAGPPHRQSLTSRGDLESPALESDTSGIRLNGTVAGFRPRITCAMTEYRMSCGCSARLLPCCKGELVRLIVKHSSHCSPLLLNFLIGFSRFQSFAALSALLDGCGTV
jgi:hypothetical protein